MRLVVSVFLFLSLYQNVFCQQFDNSNVLLFKELDSVVVSNIFYRDKEFNGHSALIFVPAKKDSISGRFTLPHNNHQEIKDTIFVQTKKRLTNNQISRLNNFLQNKKSYSKSGVALLNHYNVEISYYQKGVVSQYIRISSVTNKITIYREGCQSFLDQYNQEIDPCLFYGTVSRNFKKYVLKLAGKQG